MIICAMNNNEYNDLPGGHCGGGAGGGGGR